MTDRSVIIITQSKRFVKCFLKKTDFTDGYVLYSDPAELQSVDNRVNFRLQNTVIYLYRRVFFFIFKTRHPPGIDRQHGLVNKCF